MTLCDHEPHLLADRPGLPIIADKGYVLEHQIQLAHHGHAGPAVAERRRIKSDSLDARGVAGV